VLAAADCAVMSRHSVASAEATRAEPVTASERAHRALALGRIVALLVAGAAVAFATGLGRPLSGEPLATSLVISLAIIALVEGAARTFGLMLRDRAWQRLKPVSRVVETVLALPLAVAGIVERKLQSVMPARPSGEEERETSAEQFRQVVAAEAEESGVSRREAALLRGAFTLGETEVREIMVPRVDIMGVDLETPWSEVVDRARSAEHARLPAYNETLDDIVGVLYVKDMLASVIAGEPPEEGWQHLVRPTTFIPTSKPIDDQLREFQATGGHMAVVVDEFGGTAGIVTFEDILEEIVGEIQDEHDVEEPPVESERGGRFWVAGRVSIDELAELLDMELDLEGVTTVGGMVYTVLGRVPRAGESFTHGKYKVVVERVRRRRIERVYFERIDARDAGDDAGEDGE
jgi:putative hemolysin